VAKTLFLPFHSNTHVFKIVIAVTKIKMFDIQTSTDDFNEKTWCAKASLFFIIPNLTCNPLSVQYAFNNYIFSIVIDYDTFESILLLLFNKY